MNFIVKHFSELSGKEVFNIANVRTKVFLLEQCIREEDLDELDLDAYHMYLYNKGIVAYCRILKTGTLYNEASIGRVLVTKEFRKKGIAVKMMKEAIDYIFNEMNEKSIKISAQEYVTSLYESIGFEKEGKVYNEAGIPHIKMVINNDRC